jgi:hypothetical protein
MPPVKPGAKYTNKIGTGQSLVHDTVPVVITVVVMAATIQYLNGLS